MLKRLCISRPAISARLATLTGTRKRIPSDLITEEWAVAEKLVDVLKPFKDATEFISQQSHRTIGVVMPIVTRLMNHHLVECDDDQEEIASFKAVILADLKERWQVLADKIPYLFDFRRINFYFLFCRTNSVRDLIFVLILYMVNYGRVRKYIMRKSKRYACCRCTSIPESRTPLLQKTLHSEGHF
jgi:hypothetical protein